MFVGGVFVRPYRGGRSQLVTVGLDGGHHVACDEGKGVLFTSRNGRGYVVADVTGGEGDFNLRYAPVAVETLDRCKVGDRNISEAEFLVPGGKGSG